MPRRRNKNGATATYPKMMPWQHIGSGSPQRYRCKRRRERVMQDGGVIPAIGFPRVDGMAMGTCKKHVRHVANASISCNLCIRPPAVVLGGIPSKHAYSERNDSVRCRGSRRSQNGRSGSSGTRFGEGLDEPNVYGAAVVVDGRRGTWHHIVWSYTFRRCSCRQCRGTHCLVESEQR